MATCDAPKICEPGPVLYENPIAEKAFPGGSNRGIRFKTTTAVPVRVLIMGLDLTKIYNRLSMKTLSQDPEDRYVTCVEFHGDLAVALNTCPSKNLKKKEQRV